MKILSVDIETTELGTSRIGFCEMIDGRIRRTGSFVWTAAVRAETQRLFDDPTYTFFVFHNCTYDVPRLEADGLVIDHDRLFDTMWAAHMDQPDLPKALGAMWRYIPRPMKSWKNESVGRPAFYNAMDCEVTGLIFWALYRRLAEHGQLPIFLVGTMKTIWVLHRMQMRGIDIDEAWLKRWALELETAVSTRVEEWSRKAEQLAGRPISPTSPVQIAYLIHEVFGWPVQATTKTGRPQTDEDTLHLYMRRQRKSNPEQVEFVEEMLTIKHLAKNRSTYATDKHIHPDGKIHPRYLPAMKEAGAKERGESFAATLRFTASGPNIQNQKKAAREQYRPPQRRWVVGDTDQSAVEGRVQAWVAGDTDLMQAYLEGRDIHQENADMIAQVLGLKPGPEVRPLAKTFLYAFNYNATKRTIAQHMNVQEKVAQELIDAYEQLRPLTAKWRRELIKEVKTRRYLSNAFNMRRYFPGAGAENAPKGLLNKAVNVIPQGTVAGMWLMMMPSLEQAVEKAGGHLMAQVHDSIVWTAPEQNVEKVMLAITPILQQEWNNISPGFWVPCEHSIGPNWGKVVPYDEWVSSGRPSWTPVAA